MEQWHSFPMQELTETLVVELLGALVPVLDLPPLSCDKMEAEMGLQLCTTAVKPAEGQQQQQCHGAGTSAPPLQPELTRAASSCLPATGRWGVFLFQPIKAGMS